MQIDIDTGRRHNAAHQHEKKNVVVDVTSTVYAESTAAPEYVVVFVDPNGVPISTSTNWDVPATPTPSPSSSYVYSSSSAYSSSSSYVEPSSTSTTSYAAASSSASSDFGLSLDLNVDVEVSSSYSEAASTSYATSSTYYSSASSTVSSRTTSASSSSSSASASGHGVVYSPYKADGSCKTQDEVNTDFASFASNYGYVRTYGTDCDQTATVLTACKSYGIKIFAGIYDLSTLSSEVDLIVSAASGDWSSFYAIAVGNELVNAGTADAATVVSAISTARSLLTNAGYTGSVVTVDTLVAMRNYPELCNNSDFCACNSHPFFDGGVAAADSGDFLTTQIATLAAVVDSGKSIIVTETGWPSKGDTNGKAVPSEENQASAIASIKSAFTSNPEGVILFTPFNDYWKKNDASQFNAEQYWGFLGDSPSG